ncbi:MAG TPA: hypothetical protein VE933_10420 [Chitinophagaceae bacterium]|nr:hypothetical protein [Chitinophagaceae bacterium]
MLQIVYLNISITLATALSHSKGAVSNVLGNAGIIEYGGRINLRLIRKTNI